MMTGNAAELFSEGNEAFVDEDFELAFEKYSQAIALSPANLASCYLKRATTHEKLEQHPATLADLEQCLALDGGNQKALLKKAVTLFKLQRFGEAMPILKNLPADAKTNTWQRKCEAELDLKESTESPSEISVGFSCDLVNTADIDMDCKTTESSVSKTTCNVKPTTTTCAPVAAMTKTKHDWYQTEACIIISVMIKRVQEKDVDVSYGEKSLSLTVKLPSGSDYSLELDLAHPIVPEDCSTKVLSTKLELKMKKAEGIHWSSLESDNESQYANVVKPIATEANNSEGDTGEKAATAVSVQKYPTSSKSHRDWDSLAREVTEDEKKEEESGDAALNSMFKKIYGDGSDEVKKAMNKSFQESGGTVLSTNWGEIGSQKTEIKPPDSMEYKEYEQ